MDTNKWEIVPISTQQHREEFARIFKRDAKEEDCIVRRLNTKCLYWYYMYDSDKCLHQPGERYDGPAGPEGTHQYWSAYHFLRNKIFNTSEK